MTGGALAARIDAAHDALSPQELRVADFLRARPGESALYNSSELARRTGVSKATVSRLFRRLGFAGSHEVRDLLRAERGAGLPVVLAGDGDPIAAHAARDAENVRRVAELDGRAVVAAAEALARAPRVVVIGARSGFPVAMLLRQALAQCRADVRLLPDPGQTLGEDIVALTPEDVVVIVGLRRRTAAFARLLAVLAAGPARSLLIADASQPAVPVTWRLDVPIESASPFDSYAAAASLVSLLAGAVLVALGEAGAARVAAIDAEYRVLGELGA